MALSAALVVALLVTQSRMPTILHSYPEPGNFSYVELVCVASDIQSSSVMTGARFQLNGTEIGEDEMTETLKNGSVRLLLTQEKEGFFTCTHDVLSMSSSSIGLAGIISMAEMMWLLATAFIYS